MDLNFAVVVVVVVVVVGVGVVVGEDVMDVSVGVGEDEDEDEDEDVDEGVDESIASDANNLDGGDEDEDVDNSMVRGEWCSVHAHTLQKHDPHQKKKKGRGRTLRRKVGEKSA